MQNRYCYIGPGWRIKSSNSKSSRRYLLSYSCIGNYAKPSSSSEIFRTKISKAFRQSSVVWSHYHILPFHIHNTPLLWPTWKYYLFLTPYWDILNIWDILFIPLGSSDCSDKTSFKPTYTRTKYALSCRSRNWQYIRNYTSLGINLPTKIALKNDAIYDREIPGTEKELLMTHKRNTGLATARNWRIKKVDYQKAQWAYQRECEGQNHDPRSRYDNNHGHISPWIAITKAWPSRRKHPFITKNPCENITVYKIISSFPLLDKKSGNPREKLENSFDNSLSFYIIRLLLANARFLYCFSLSQCLLLKLQKRLSK